MSGDTLEDTVEGLKQQLHDTRVRLRLMTERAERFRQVIQHVVDCHGDKLVFRSCTCGRLHIIAAEDVKAILEGRH
jgi:hypothetical protein